MAKPFEVKDDTFAKDVEGSKGLVLVDFGPPGAARAA